MLFSLFCTFAFIGAFSFGGGYGMLPLIQKEIVLSHHWLTSRQFADILAVSEMTPGPIAINSATYVGYTVAGFWGSVMATVGVTVPSFVIILTLAGIVQKNKDNPYFKAAFQGLRPVVVGLITGAAVLVGIDSITSLPQLGLAVLALLLMLFTRLHPILIILLFGLGGVLVF